MNARFWIYWNDSPVKLTLRPGDVIYLHECHETDEGFSFHTELYEHDGDSIICETVSGGRDCDGPIEHHSVHEVPLWKMEPHPKWLQVKAWQRDAYAEQMGY